MSLRRGFKKEANSYAREFRTELGLRAHDPLCPWKLAAHLDIPVVSLSQLQDQVAIHHLHYLMEYDRQCFSAVTVFRGYRRMIVHNDAHSKNRQASNISHEVSHAILQHPPMEPFGDFGCRNFIKELEDEADWLGPALLISEEAALHIVKTGMTIPQAIDYYSVTKEVLSMRLNVTAARRRCAFQR
jgi:Zn-dependent peptidase ImmA (M78 family)